jgi:hypothetical protein
MNKQKPLPSLVFCLVMDLIGYATYTIPVFGEIGDIFWAPISAFIFWRAFGGWKGAAFNFMEEALPGLDFIPSFTLMWFMKKLKSPQQKFYPITNR